MAPYITVRMRVPTGDGVEVEVVAGGSGPPLLLVHGFGGAKEDFADHLGALGDRWSVAAFDHRGHGASDHPSDPAAYTLDRLAADTLAVADALGFDEFRLLGHSMGGMVARRVALIRPERVRALVLMGTSAGPPAGLDPALVDAGVQLATSDWSALSAALDEAGPIRTPAYDRLLAQRPGFREFATWKWSRVSPVMWAALAPQIAREPDSVASLRQLRCPTLVIVGALDQAFLGPSLAMAAAIRGSRLYVVPDAGHHPQFENPSAWLDAVQSFLGDVVPDRPRCA